MIVLEDERYGLPSASSMPRIHGKDGCLGSFHLEAHLVDIGNRKPANYGEKVHAVMEGRLKMDGLTHSGKICAERMAYQEGELVEELGFEGSTQFKEQRFWTKDQSGKKLFSGKPDVVHILHDRALVINFKTGFANPRTGYVPVTPIGQNKQMLCEAIVVAGSGNWLFKSISVALIHPNYKLENGAIRQSLTKPIEQIRMHLAPMIQTAVGAVHPEAPFNPSVKNCEWCRGKKSGACAAYQIFKNNA